MSKEQERAESYRSMMNQWAWKDFVEIMKDDRQKALENGIISSSIENVQLNRGKVQEIDSLLSELDSIVNAK